MIDKLKSFLANQKLPGKDQQLKFTKYQKLLERIDLEQIKPRLSAVCIVLYPYNDKWFSVLIERPTYKGVHSGQIAFPGGKTEKDDKSLWQTAQRETFEEVGIAMQDLEYIGALTNIYIPPSNFMVYPFVGVLNNKPSFVKDPKEVARIITYDINTLLDNSIIKQMDMEQSNNNKVHTTYYDIEGNVVWGATAMMLTEFKEILKRINF